MSPYAQELIRIIAPLVDVERRAVHCQSSEEYRALMEANRGTNDTVISQARTYVEAAGLNRADLQEVFYEVTHHEAYFDPDDDKDDGAVRGAVIGIMNDVFPGIDGWAR